MWNPGHPSLISSFPFPLRLQPPPSPLSSACATTPPPPSPQPLFHAEASSTILLQPPPHPLPADHSSFLVLGDEFRSKYKMPPGRKVQTNRTAVTPTCNSSSLSAGKGNNEWIWGVPMGFVFFFCVLMFELRVWGEGILVPVGESVSSGSEWVMAVRLHRLELLGKWAASEGHLERGVA